jgi:hypothetical protein
MDYTKIIFIDPGTKWGWTIWEKDSLLYPVDECWDGVTTGSCILPTAPGPRVVEFWNMLEDITKLGLKWPGSAVAHEGMFIAWEESAFTGFSKADRMYGMWEGLLILFCELHKVPYLALSGSRIKGYIGREGFYPSMKERKLLPKAERKPRPRLEWQFTCEKKMLEHEVDSRWGLEYLIKEVLE